MMIGAKMQVQRRPFTGSFVCKVHVMAANTPTKPATIRPADKPDALKQLGTALGAVALAATMTFGGNQVQSIHAPPWAVS